MAKLRKTRENKDATHKRERKQKDMGVLARRARRVGARTGENAVHGVKRIPWPATTGSACQRVEYRIRLCHFFRYTLIRGHNGSGIKLKRATKA